MRRDKKKRKEMFVSVCMVNVRKERKGKNRNGLKGDGMGGIHSYL